MLGHIGKGAPRHDSPKELIAGIVLISLFCSSIVYHFISGLHQEWQPLAIIDPFKDGYPLKYKIMAVASLVLPLIIIGLLFRSKKNSGIHGDARPASEKEIRKAGLMANTGVVLGVYKPRWYSRAKFIVNGKLKSPESILAVQPTGIGKTSGIMIPTICHYPGSIMISDVAGDLEKKTAAHRARYSDVYIVRIDGKPSHKINILDYIRGGLDRHSDCSKMAGVYFPRTEGGTFWDKAPNTFLTNLFVLVCELNDITTSLNARDPSIEIIPRTMGSIWRLMNPTVIYKDDNGALLDIPPDNFDALKMSFHSLFKTFPEINQKTKAQISRFVDTSKKMRDGVVESLSDVLDFWMNPRVDDATSSSDFDLRDIRRRPMTIYLQFSSDDYETYAPMIKAIFDTAFKQLCTALPTKDEPYTVLYGLDEFANLGRIPNIDGRATQMRKFGGHILALIQSINQMPDVYGPTKSSVILSAFKQQVFSVCNDPETAQYISKRGFSKTVDSVSTSNSKFSSSLEARLSTGVASEKLIKDYEPYTLPKGESIIFAESMYPIKGRIIESWKYRKYRKIEAFSEANMIQIENRTVEKYAAFNDLELVAMFDEEGCLVAAGTRLQVAIEKRRKADDVLAMPLGDK